MKKAPESSGLNILSSLLNQNAPLRITLNIGGQIFETTEQTLLRYDSIFKDFLSRKNESFSPVWFFDRDPTHFQLILNFFRTGLLHYPSDPAAEEALKLELRFYQIRDLLDKSRFHFQRFNDRNGILFLLGSRNRYCFENPVESKEIEVFLGDSYIAYLKSKLIEAPLKKIFDFSDKISEEKIVFSPKNPNAFLLVRFKNIRVKLNAITVENVKAKDLDYFKEDLKFYGRRSESLVEAVKDKENWIEIERKKFVIDPSGLWTHFELQGDEFYNTIKIERVLPPSKPSSPQLMLSAIEFYGCISEKN